MSASNSVARISRNALVSFVLLLTIIFLGAEAVLLLNQRGLVFDEVSREVDSQVKILGNLAVEAILRSDYESVDRMLQRWAQSHRDVLEVRAIFPNGFVLSHITRESPKGSVFDVTHTVEFAGRSLLDLSVRLDRSPIAASVSDAFYKFSALVVGIIAFLGWVLWAVLRRTAIVPYENEILKHEETEHELKRRTQELEALNDELNAFCYSISHDLRAPLRAIDGYGHILNEEYGSLLDDAGKAYISRSRAAARRIGDVIDDLLRLTLLARRNVEREHVDLSAMAREIGAELANRNPGRNVAFKVEDGMSVCADAGLVRIVLDNILGNAWKYTAKTRDASIEFGSTPLNGETAFFVRDNGAGFNAEFAHKLFSPFQRLHTESEFPGTGIGLATVSRIIQRHGGKIYATGAVDGGATFSFTFGS